MIKMDTNDLLTKSAMEMIVHAGEARNHLNQALNELYEGHVEEYEKLMKLVKEKITESHRAQTQVLQSTIADTTVYPSILFTHAQDTLMTVMSEVNIATYLAKIIHKISKMEIKV